ncbi:MAG: HEPN family nuclease [Desulfomonilaceae bacterium]
MEFAAEFEKDFMKRTLDLVKNYQGDFDTTLLLNCLLGLLIVPRETSLNKIPTDPIYHLKNWGISPESIIRRGSRNRSNEYPDTLRSVVYSLKNSVAHFRIQPVQESRSVKGFHFSV